MRKIAWHHYLLAALTVLFILGSGSICIYADSWLWPVPDSRQINQYYGEYVTGSFHEGLDIGGALNTRIVAAKDGTVCRVLDGDVANVYYGAGRGVVIDHGNGVYSHYIHMNATAVSVGQQVSAGTLIGYMGATGNATGVHLHFAIAYNSYGGGDRINVNPGALSYVYEIEKRYDAEDLAKKYLDSVSEGLYYIASSADNSCCLDVPGDSKENGANVRLFKRSTAFPHQLFRVTYLGGGFYRLTHVQAKTVLDVSGAGQSSGTNVQMYEWNGTAAQQWVLKPSSNSGCYEIVSRCNGLCVDLSGGTVANDTNIQMYVPNQTAAQYWKFISYDGSQARRTIEDGSYHIISAKDRTKGLDVSGQSTAVNANVQIYANTTDPAQTFTVKYLNNGYYAIIYDKTGMYLDVDGGSYHNGANVKQYNGGGNDAEQWMILETSESGVYEIISKYRYKALDIAGGNTANGTNVQIYARNGTPAQKWLFVKADNGQTECEKNGHKGGTATCVRKAVCTVCGEEYGNTNPDHHNPVKESDQAATCTEDGYTGATVCLDCGATITERQSIPALGHDWGEWKVLDEPTKEKEGLKVRVCKRDPDHIDREVIPIDGEEKKEGEEEKGEGEKEEDTRIDVNTLRIRYYLSKAVYTGQPLKPVFVLDGDKTLEEGTDYRISYRNNINVGKCEFTVEGCGNYRGIANKTFQITKAVNSIRLTSPLSYTVKYSKLKKQAQTITLKAAANEGAKITFELLSVPKKAKKYVSLSASGKLRIKKKLAKGSYSIGIRVNSGAVDNYYESYVNKTVRIIVK